VAAEHLKQKVRPECPWEALDRQVEGDDVLDVLIGKNGKVKRVKVEHGDPILTQAAVDAVRHWRYSPFASEGQSVEPETTVTLSFALIKGPFPCPGQEHNKYSFPSDAKKTPDSPVANATENDLQPVVFKVGGG